MAIEWRKELDYLLYLLFVGLLGWLAPAVLGTDVAYFSNVVTVLTLIFGLLLVKNLVTWEELSEKLYDAGVYSLFIVISAFFLDGVLKVAGYSSVYSSYLAGFGYLLAFVFILLAALVYVFKRVFAK